MSLTKDTQTHWINATTARRHWIDAQRLDRPDSFGSGPAATRFIVEHLGYVQIDTINVIERSHHHILYTRNSAYRRGDLHAAQTFEKSVFEYWTHALAYVPVQDFRFFVPDMKAHRRSATRWYADVPPAEVNRVVKRIREEGPLTIRDITDDALVEKDHPWASRKPSKRALQRAFFDGRLVISERVGMLKTYELTERHFGWDKLPDGATERQGTAYLLDRALRAQRIVSLRSIHHTHARHRPALEALIESRVRKKTLVPVTVEGAEKVLHWAEPASLAAAPAEPTLCHILSPFDPLVIQRNRLKMFFGYEHLFEAYVPKDKRRFGYFTLPVLLGDRFVAALDLKTDRAGGKLLIQSWHWLETETAAVRQAIEEALHRFERFQLSD